MASIGDVFVSLRLDSSPFERGITSAQQQTQRLGQVLDQFGRPLAAVASGTAVAGDALVQVGESASRASGHFDLGSRSVARFAAIGIQEFIPSLQGSRLAIEQTLQPIARLGGSFGALALGVTGVAALIGGYLYNHLSTLTSGAIRSREGVRGLADEITQLEEKITKSLPGLEEWGRLVTHFGGRRDIGFEMSGAPTAADIGDTASARAARLSFIVGGARSDIERARGNQLLEDPNAGPAGAIANKLREDAAKTWFDLEKAVRVYKQTVNEAAVTDPLQKMLVTDWHRAQELIDKLQEIADPKLRDELIGVVAAAGGERQVGIRNAFGKEHGPAAALALGLGDNNLFAGFKGIEDLQGSVRGVTGEIERMARAGVPARDLFDAIGKAQEGLDKKVADLNARFADQPAVLDKVRTAFGAIEFGGLARDLDAMVRSIENVGQGTATIIDTAEGLQTTWAPALEKAGLVATRFFESIEASRARAIEASTSLVTLTGDVRALGEAFEFARVRAIMMNTAVGGAVDLGGASAPAPAPAGE
jgi:hypothetical protein